MLTVHKWWGKALFLQRTLQIWILSRSKGMIGAEIKAQDVGNLSLYGRHSCIRVHKIIIYSTPVTIRGPRRQIIG